MTITAQMIKELRDRTGIGMGKCKEALTEAQGDIELAIKNLRKSGAASAVKKEGRATSEGVIAIAQNEETCAVVEINAETDFVVKNDNFQEFANKIALEVAQTKPESLDAFLKQSFSDDTSMTIDEYRGTMVQTIGENIKISRLQTFPMGSDHSLGIYAHHSGKIAAVVDVQGSGSEKEFAKEVAMHIAAAAPEYVAPEDVPADILDMEKEIAKTQLKGKPPEIMEKILVGKVRAFCDQHCLIKQKFVKDESTTIEQLLSARAKESGSPLKIASFLRWNVGQKTA